MKRSGAVGQSFHSVCSGFFTHPNQLLSFINQVLLLLISDFLFLQETRTFSPVKKTDFFICFSLTSFFPLLLFGIWNFSTLILNTIERSDRADVQPDVVNNIYATLWFLSFFDASMGFHTTGGSHSSFVMISGFFMLLIKT